MQLTRGELLVGTGATLRANGLVEVEHIADISAWLVANKAAMKMKHVTLKSLVKQLDAAVMAQHGP